MRDASDIKRRFLKALGETHGNVKGACEALGVSDQNYRYWRKTDADFAAQCDLIRESHKAARNEARRQQQEQRKTEGARHRIEQSRESQTEDNGLGIYTGTPFAALCAKAVKRITDALEARGIYDEGMQPQIEVLARATANLEVMLWQVDKYAPLQVEYSREGNARLVSNPIHGDVSRATESLSRQYAKLGLGYDPDREAGQSAHDFMSKFDDND